MLSDLILLFFLFEIILIKYINCDFVFLDDTLQVDDQCEFNQTHKGICADHCPRSDELYRNFDIFPKLCSISDDGNVLYCCPETINTYDRPAIQTNLNRSEAYIAADDIKKPNQTSYEEYDECEYNNKITGVCRTYCPNLNFPNYKLRLTEKKWCPAENGSPLECCINHLQIAYDSAIFNLSKTYEEGDFCPYNRSFIGICDTHCYQNLYNFQGNTFSILNPICSHQLDGTPIYCCADYFTTYAESDEVVPFAYEGDYCIQQNTKSGRCKSECKKLEKLESFGVIPTMCRHDIDKNPLFCCPDVNDEDELQKYRYASSGRIFYEKCQEYQTKRTYTRFKRKIHNKTPISPIAGGWNTDYGDYPHMAGIGWTNANGKIEWNCGGSLISDDFILTAAHCTSYNGRSPDTVRIGEIYLDLKNTTKSDESQSSDFLSKNSENAAQNFTIIKIIKHPEYSHFSSYNDIALIKLNQSVTITRTVHPACLWNDNDDIDDELTAFALGYGSSQFGGANTRKLTVAFLRTINQEDCINIYKNFSKLSTLKNGVQDTQLCAGDPKGVQDTCQGDSGSPLQFQLFDVHYIYGITSVGQYCPSQTPGIYTKVSKFVDWIESIVWPRNSKKLI